MNELKETLEIFFAESEDLLKGAEEGLLALESAPECQADLDRLFRSIHTLKSGAAMVGFQQIADYAHLLETLLDRLRMGKMSVTNDLITFLLNATDFIRSMVDSVAQAGPEADPAVLDKRKDEVRRYLGVDVAHPPAGTRGPAIEAAPARAAERRGRYKVWLRFRKDLFYSGQDPLVVLSNLAEVGEIMQVVADLSGLPDYENFSAYELYISWQVIVEARGTLKELQDVFIFVRDDNDIRIEDITGLAQESGAGPADSRLGELLVDEGSITENELNHALIKQQILRDSLPDDGTLEPKGAETGDAAQDEAMAAHRKTTIRVDVNKLDSLMNLSEEMGIGLARVQRLFEKHLGPEQMELAAEIEDLILVNRDFQEHVEMVRMFPLEGTFRRFQRMARDLAVQQDKKIRVESAGLDTEMDKEVIEHLADPLKHLVRNCVDHGIERPEVRRAKGKPEEGIIGFRAYQRGGRVLVEIRDDGKGIDVEEIHRRAIELGWIRPGQDVGRAELIDLIFKPGFSTSRTVTGLSGRGVGMDVVRTRLNSIGGGIEIRTEKDKGSTFTLSVPLTSALMEVLHVMVAGASYLVPQQHVVGTERIEKNLIKTIGTGGRVYPFRGEYVPVVDIARIFNMDTASAQANGGAAIFVNTGARRFCLPVDEILEPRQVIVKALEKNYRSVNGIAGATVLGDGAVSLVVDLLGVEELFFDKSFERGEKHEGEEVTLY